MAKESAFGWGFGITCGVVSAILAVVCGVTLLWCGGCATFIGGTAAVVNEGAEARRELEARQQQSRPAAVVPAASPVVVDEPAPEALPTAPGPAHVPEEVPEAEPVPNVSPMPETQVTDTVQSESRAIAKLKLAQNLMKAGNTIRGRQFLTEIVRDFPGTSAASEAAKMLE